MHTFDWLNIKMNMKVDIFGTNVTGNKYPMFDNLIYTNSVYIDAV